MKKILLLLIVITALAIRLWVNTNAFFWHVDEDIVALTAKRIVVEHRPQLIGFPIPGGIYLGPSFYYIASSFYLLSAMNPYNLAIFAAGSGAISTLLVYIVGSEIFKKRSVGLIASVIYGVSTLTVVYSSVFTALTFAPIYSLLTYLFLFRFISTKKRKYLLFLLLVLLLASQNEGSSISLLVLAVISLLFWKIKLRARDWIFVLISFFIFQLPLLLFDLRHNFFITKSLSSFFTRLGEGDGGTSFGSALSALSLFPFTLSRIFMISGPHELGAQILPCPDLIVERLNGLSWLAIFSAIVILTIFTASSVFRTGAGKRIIAAHLVVMLGGLFLYNLFMPGYLFEWILVVFFPAFALVTAYVLYLFFSAGFIFKIITIVVIVVFSFFNIVWSLTLSGNFGLSEKIAATKVAMQLVDKRSFYLDTLGSCFQNGYMYLFWYFGRAPTHSWADEMFAPTYFPVPVGDRPKTGVVMVNPSTTEGLYFWIKYIDYKKKTVKSATVGQIEILMVEDKNLPE